MIKKILNKIIINILSLSIIVAASGLSAPLSFAAINSEINYQGKLTDTSDVRVADGSYDMRFKLYTTATGGSPIWTEVWCFSPDSGTTCDGTGTDSRVTVTDGLFSTMLGSTTALTSVNFNQTLYLSVEIGGSGTTPSWDGEMTPRKRIGSVPSAFEADKLDGQDGTYYLNFNNLTNTGTTSLPDLVTVGALSSGSLTSGFGAIDIGSDTLAAGNTTIAGALTTTGNIGIGTTSPSGKLAVTGPASGYTAYMEDSSGNPDFVLTAGGDIGIGTANPGVLPSVWGGGNSGIHLVSNNPEIRLEDSSLSSDSLGAITMLAWRDGDGETLGAWQVKNAKANLIAGQINIERGVGADNEGTITFDTLNAGTLTEAMRIDQDGNVGIGTTSPSGKLAVTGPASGFTAYMEDSSGNPDFVIEAGGNVGIGTANPAQELEVQVGSDPDETLQIKNLNNRPAIQALDTNGSNVWVNGFTSTVFEVGTDQADPMALTTNGAQRLYIEGGGDIGIGTTSPGSLLDVYNGEVSLSDADIAGGGTINTRYARMAPVSATAGGFYLQGESDADAAGMLLAGQIGSTNPTDTTPAIYLSGSKWDGAGTGGQALGANETVLRVDNYTTTGLLTVLGSGNVGIGTTSPAKLLSVHGDALFSGDLSLANLTATGTLSLTGTSGTSTIASGQGFTVGSSQFVVQQGSGNVGVGTLSPTTLLDVSGGSFHVGDGTRIFQAYGSANQNVVYAGAFSNHALRLTTNNNPVMELLPSGNVGIGTTTPSDELEIAAAATPRVKVTASGASSAGLLFNSEQTAADATLALIQAQWNTNLVADILFKSGADTSNKDDGYMQFRTSNDAGGATTRMTISQAGNVGIATTSPSGTLAVTGPASGYTAYMEDSSGNADFVLTAGGDIGIGTANPGAKLHIIDADDTTFVASSFDGEIRTTVNSATANTYSGIRFQNNAFVNAGIAGLSVQGNSNAEGELIFMTSPASGSQTERMRIDSVGFVGIGTTSPSGKLAVTGPASGFTAYMEDSSGNADFALLADGKLGLGTLTPTDPVNSSANVFEISGSDNATLHLNGTAAVRQAQILMNGKRTAAGDIGVWIALNDGDTVGNISFARDGADDAAAITFDTQATGGSPSERMRITSAGNVGIGTTSPSGKLAVTGPASGFTAYMEDSSGNPDFVLTAGGDIGIGTASPIGKLHVTGDGTSGTVTPNATGDDFVIESAGSSGMTFINPTNGAGYIYWADSEDSIAARISYNHNTTLMDIGTKETNGQLSLHSADGVEALRIDVSQNVGIGTTSPGSLLSLGSIANFTTATSTFYSTGGINLENGCFAVNGTCITGGGSSGVTVGGSVTSGTANRILYEDSSNQLAESSSLFFDGTNFGIGTSSPNWLLQIAGTRPFLTISDSSAGVNKKHWTISSQGGDLYFATSTDAYATSSSPAFTILDNGYIGVATATPTTRFSIPCPDGFASIESKGEQLGCMQIAEEGSAGLDTAESTCFETYGGRVPSRVEWYIAATFYALTDETDDAEWKDDAADLGCGVNSGTYTPAGTMFNINCKAYTTATVYRCWIPR